MSWLADHYADKELLFHLLFVPLGGLGWVTASKVVGTLAGAAVLFSIYLVLRAEQVRFAAVWAVLPLATSSAFLYRFVLVRPHLLSIALVVIVLWAASRRRLAVLAAAALVYPWAYVAWFLPVVLVALAEVARGVGGERPGWKPGAVAAAAIAVGVAVHPNGANLVRFTWLRRRGRSSARTRGAGGRGSRWGRSSIRSPSRSGGRSSSSRRPRRRWRSCSPGARGASPRRRSRSRSRRSCSASRPSARRGSPSTSSRSRSSRSPSRSGRWSARRSASRPSRSPRWPSSTRARRRRACSRGCGRRRTGRPRTSRPRSAPRSRRARRCSPASGGSPGT